MNHKSVEGFSAFVSKKTTTKKNVDLSFVLRNTKDKSTLFFFLLLSLGWSTAVDDSSNEAREKESCRNPFQSHSSWCRAESRDRKQQATGDQHTHMRAHHSHTHTHRHTHVWAPVSIETKTHKYCFLVAVMHFQPSISLTSNLGDAVVVFHKITSTVGD